MKFAPVLFAIIALFVSSSMVFSQQPTAPANSTPFAGKTADQLTADEVMKLVRYSYTLFDRDFRGQLRVGFNKKVPFILSLKPEAIRFIFSKPAHIIYLDTKDKKFALYEGKGGAQLSPVPAGSYGKTLRGTDVTYDDISMRFLYWPNAKIVDQQRIKNRNTWVVRVRNPDGAGLYSTVDCWVDKVSGGMLKMIGYNAKGRPIRRFEVIHGKKMGDIWMVDEMRIETIDPKTGKRVSHTRMQIEETIK